MAALFSSSLAAGELRVAAPADVAPLYARWIAEYGAEKARLSPGGRGEVRAGRAEVSAAPPEQADVAVPVAVSAVALGYNVLIAGDLRLDAEALEAILSGHLTRWRDPLLARLNPGAVFPDLPLHVVLPAEGEPEAATLREYLARTLGRAPRPFVATKIAAGLEAARFIGNTEGAIGLVDASLARRSGLFLAALRNRAGQFTPPSARSVSRAAVGVKLPEDLRASIVDANGADAYPVAALVYATYQPRSDAARAFLRWVIHDGQRAVTPLGYAQLPGLLTLLVEARLKAP